MIVSAPDRSLDEAEAQSIVLELIGMREGQLLSAQTAAMLSEVAARAVSAAVEGTVSSVTATVLLETVFRVADYISREQSSSAVTGAVARACCEQLPADGVLSRELYGSLCFPFPVASPDCCSVLLLEKGVRAGHSWPQASCVLEGLTVTGEILQNYRFMPSMGAPADFALTAWAGFIEGLDPVLRSSLVPISEQSGLRGWELVRLAAETLDFDFDALPVDPVGVYAARVGRGSMDPFDDLISKGEGLLSWCEDEANQKSPAFGVDVRSALYELRFFVWSLDGWFGERGLPGSYPAGLPLPDAGAWNAVAASWAVRVMRLSEGFPEFRDLWGSEVEYTAQALGGENLVGGLDGFHMVDERARLLVTQLPLVLDDCSRRFVADFGLGQVPSPYDDVPASCLLMSELFDRLVSDLAGGYRLRLASLSDEDRTECLSALFLALGKGEGEFLKAARVYIGVNGISIPKRGGSVVFHQQ